MTIDIIGGGIGGLTTAIALGQKQFRVRIFEQAREIKAVGAGIILANNAMQVYQKLGLRERLEELGNTISSMRITTAGLQLISSIDLKHFEKKFGVRNVAIHRGLLQKVLVESLPAEVLHLGKKLQQISGDPPCKLHFADGSSIISEMLLGADGINSAVRVHLFPKTLVRMAKQVCWRGVLDFELPDRFSNELNEAWGKGSRVGFVKIGPNRVYWYALKSYRSSPNELKDDDLINYFLDFHPLIKDLISATPKAQIHTAEMSDLKPFNKWHRENICLLGDAAHATTPNLGQGACQAIEDAYVLAECMSRHGANEAFANFNRLRRQKAHQVVNTSWTLGKLAHLENSFLIWLRNSLMRQAPASANRKQSEKIFDLPSF